MILNKSKIKQPKNLKFKYDKFSILTRDSEICACNGATVQY